MHVQPHWLKTTNCFKSQRSTIPPHTPIPTLIPDKQTPHCQKIRNENFSFSNTLLILHVGSSFPFFSNGNFQCKAIC